MDMWVSAPALPPTHIYAEWVFVSLNMLMPNACQDKCLTLHVLGCSDLLTQTEQEAPGRKSSVQETVLGRGEEMGPVAHQHKGIVLPSPERRAPSYLARHAFILEPSCQAYCADIVNHAIVPTLSCCCCYAIAMIILKSSCLPNICIACGSNPSTNMLVSFT